MVLRVSHQRAPKHVRAQTTTRDSMGADVMGMRAASKGPCGPCGMLMGGVPHIMMLLVDRIVSTVDGWGVDDSGNACPHLVVMADSTSS